MKGTRNDREWNRVCAEIKEARGGAFPPDWWTRVMASGFAKGVTASWNSPGTTDIKVTVR